ncbi:MAG: hypothetical protein ACTHZ9_13290 [Leucobacter sp.]
MTTTPNTGSLPVNDDTATDDFESFTMADVIVGIAESESWFATNSTESPA